MTDRSPSISTTRLVMGRLSAILVALLFSFQAVMAAVPPAPRADDAHSISSMGRLAGVAHVRDAPNLIPAVVKGAKSNAGTQGDGTPPLFPAAAPFPTPQIATGPQKSWQALSPLPAAPPRGAANRTRAPPRQYS